MMRMSRGLVAAALPLLAAACSGVAGRVIDASPLGTARSVVGGATGTSEFFRIRSTPSPVAGTYRITYVWDGGADSVTIYARTMEKPFTPFLDEADGAAGVAGQMKAVGYILNVYAAASPEKLITSREELKEDDERLTGGGYFWATLEGREQPDGTRLYHGSLAVELAPGESEAYDRFAEVLREYKARGEEDREAAIDAYLDDEEPPQARTEELPGTIRVFPDGRILVEQVILLDGRPHFTVHAERISADPIVN